MTALKDYISAAEAAKLINCHKNTIINACKSGSIKGQYIGGIWLVARSSAQAYVKRKPGLKIGQKINRGKKNDQR